ncbi:MAG TPA: Ku protein [Acidimicrobiales bacterium]
MARAVWSGTISFGLVNVPVKAYTAVRDHKVHFHEMDARGGRVRHEKVSAKTGKPVDEIRLGYETSKGHYVRFTPSELEELRPASTRAVDVTDFVELAEIDPIFYDRTYWLAPANDEAKPAYALLRDTMEDAQRVAIGTVVMRRKQYLAAVRPIEGALALSTMRFADEVVPSSTVEGIPARSGGKGRQKERALAGQIVDALTSEWEPERYHDTYTEELRTLIKQRSKGAKAEEPEEAPEPEGAEVVDLMAALEASVKDARKGRSGRKRRARRSA